MGQHVYIVRGGWLAMITKNGSKPSYIKAHGCWTAVEAGLPYGSSGCSGNAWGETHRNGSLFGAALSCDVACTAGGIEKMQTGVSRRPARKPIVSTFSCHKISIRPSHGMLLV